MRKFTNAGLQPLVIKIHRVCEGVITINLIPLLICVGVQSSFHICPKFLLICNEGATFSLKMSVISILSAYA